MRLLCNTACFLLLTLPAYGRPLRVIATVPDLADIARRIGGAHVQVESLARGTEDIHNVPQKPSFLPKLNRADAVVLVGLELEHAFLPALLEAAQNPRVLRGRDGYIDCSPGLKPLDVPSSLSRAEGELHPLGNPHYTMDPREGFRIAGHIAAGLSRVDPAHRVDYEKNRDRFRGDLEDRLAGWRSRAAPLQGMKAVSHHKDMAYLADFLGLVMAGTVELKPGIPPTPTHIERLVRRMKEERVTLLIREIQFSRKTADWIAAQSGARIADISTMAGAFPDTGDYFGFIDRNVRSILEAAGARDPAQGSL